MKARTLQGILLLFSVILFVVYLVAPLTRASLYSMEFTMPGRWFLVFGLEMVSTDFSHGKEIIAVALLLSYCGNLLLPLSFFTHTSRYFLLSILYGAPLAFVGGILAFSMNALAYGLQNSWGGMVWSVAIALLGIRAAILYVGSRGMHSDRRTET